MFEIKGLWAGKAGEPKPASSVTVEVGKARLFYQMKNTEKTSIKSIVQVYLDDTKILSEFQDFDTRDGLDTGFFDVPTSMQNGTKKAIIEVFTWDTNPRDSKFLFKSPVFEITFEKPAVKPTA